MQYEVGGVGVPELIEVRKFRILIILGTTAHMSGPEKFGCSQYYQINSSTTAHWVLESLTIIKMLRNNIFSNNFHPIGALLTALISQISQDSNMKSKNCQGLEKLDSKQKLTSLG